LSHCVVWMLNSSCSRNRVDATELPKQQNTGSGRYLGRRHGMEAGAGAKSVREHGSQMRGVGAEQAREPGAGAERAGEDWDGGGARSSRSRMKPR
jgi:hypothetical protein